MTRRCTDKVSLMASLLEMLFTRKPGFYRVLKEKDSRTVRLQKSRREHGVFLFSPEYAQDFNLKLSKDTYTIIITYDRGLPFGIVN